MKSLNHIYRSIWSEALNAWMAVFELIGAKGKRSGSSALNAALAADSTGSARCKLRFKPIVIAVACCFTLDAAQANPIGAQVCCR